MHTREIFFASLLLDEAYRRGRGSPGGQHRIQYEDVSFVDVSRELAVVFYGEQGVRVPVQPDVADLGVGNELQYSVDHAEPGPEYGDYRKILPGQRVGLRLRQRGLHFDLDEGEIARHLVHHESGDLLHKLPELLYRSVLVADHADLVLNQGVFEEHGLPLLGEGAAWTDFVLVIRNFTDPPDVAVPLELG